jgi:hypothetical protein
LREAHWDNPSFGFAMWHFWATYLGFFSLRQLISLYCCPMAKSNRCRSFVGMGQKHE